jgi:hypothetical protein
MNIKQMLAIVIPYYKLTFFEETLQSLAAQTDKRVTVYIGDDASPENPSMLLDKFKNEFEFVYHRFENNMGGTNLVKQWERCIAMTNNEQWIMILGDDDYLTDNVVEQFYIHYSIFNTKTNLIRFASRTIVQKQNYKAAISYHPVWENATDAYYRKFQKLTRSSLSEYVFLKASYERHHFYNYPLAWNSDDRAWLDFSEQKPIYSINDSVVCVRLSDLNITGRKDNLALKSQSLIEFYTFLITKKSTYYTKQQRIKILRKYQSELKNLKSFDFNKGLFILWHFTINMNIGSIKKFMRLKVK